MKAGLNNFVNTLPADWLPERKPMMRLKKNSQPATCPAIVISRPAFAFCSILQRKLLKMYSLQCTVYRCECIDGCSSLREEWQRANFISYFPKTTEALGHGQSQGLSSRAKRGINDRVVFNSDEGGIYFKTREIPPSSELGHLIMYYSSLREVWQL